MVTKMQNIIELKIIGKGKLIIMNEEGSIYEANIEPLELVAWILNTRLPQTCNITFFYKIEIFLNLFSLRQSILNNINSKCCFYYGFYVWNFILTMSSWERQAWLICWETSFREKLKGSEYGSLKYLTALELLPLTIPLL